MEQVTHKRGDKYFDISILKLFFFMFKSLDGERGEHKLLKKERDSYFGRLHYAHRIVNFGVKWFMYYLYHSICPQFSRMKIKLIFFKILVNVCKEIVVNSHNLLLKS